MSKIEITRELAAKVLNVVDAGLSIGRGRSEPGHMCVEAAVCFALGLPHSDKPPCVAAVVRDIKVHINDCGGWESGSRRAAGLRRLAIAQLGSVDVDRKSFINMFNTMLVQEIIPMSFNIEPMPADPEKLLEILNAKTLKSIIPTENEYMYCDHTLRLVYQVMKFDIGDNRIDNWVNIMDGLLYRITVTKAKLRPVRARLCEAIVEILIELKSPGCDFLDLAPKPT